MKEVPSAGGNLAQLRLDVVLPHSGVGLDGRKEHVIAEVVVPVFEFAGLVQLVHHVGGLFG